MDQVIIKDLLARGIIGITDRERARAQDILINATIYTDIRRAAASDAIEDCVDYSQLAKKLLAHTESVKRHTVEALVSDLARLCLEETGVAGVRISVEKPGAVRFARSVGVEIERFHEA
ncbi:MAG: dihydroneopterin aldolase [Anaerolineaceae bacterium]|nr:dihydroneopterin aldolase [Anaerolineaceae bacterium]